MNSNQTNVQAVSTIPGHIDRAIAWVERPQIAFPVVAASIALMPLVTNIWAGAGLLFTISYFGYHFAIGILNAINEASR